MWHFMEGHFILTHHFRQCWKQPRLDSESPSFTGCLLSLIRLMKFVFCLIRAHEVELARMYLLSEWWKLLGGSPWCVPCLGTRRAGPLGDVFCVRLGSQSHGVLVYSGTEGNLFRTLSLQVRRWRYVEGLGVPQSA